jgi:hypothetical protein
MLGGYLSSVLISFRLAGSEQPARIRPAQKHETLPRDSCLRTKSLLFDTPLRDSVAADIPTIV